MFDGEHAPAMHDMMSPRTIGMPELGPYGLSEAWLLRHFGDVHWRMICRSLGVVSRDIADTSGNRLYASFVRARWSSTRPLSSFGESDTIEASTVMERFQEGAFLSTSEVIVGGDQLTICLASIFSRRAQERRNDALLPALPSTIDACTIPNQNSFPAFLRDHRLLRKGALPTVALGAHSFSTADTRDEECVDYVPTGYHEFNGARLLYFASYPIIADCCQARSERVRATVGRQAFITTCSPIARDIFYFGNLDMDDTLRCALQVLALGVNEGTRAELMRASDGDCISKQFCIRERGSPSCQEGA